MNELWGTALGGGIALCGVFLNNKWSEKRFTAQVSHEDQQKIKEHKLSRAEELYGLVDEWQKAMFRMHMETNRLAAGEDTYESYIKRPIQPPSNDYRYFRIQMIISAYFPELEERYVNAETCKREVNRHRTSIEKYFEQKTDKNNILLQLEKKSYFKAQEGLDAACDELKKEIVKTIRHL